MRKKNKIQNVLPESKNSKETQEKNEGKIRQEIKTEPLKIDKKETEEKKEKIDNKVVKKDKKSSSKHKNNDKHYKNKNRKKSSNSGKSSSSSSRKKPYPLNHQHNFHLMGKKPVMNPLMKVPQQQFYPPYDYPVPSEQNFSYYYQQSYYPHNAINPMFHTKYSMNPAFFPWMNSEMKDNMMNPVHGEYMKNYYFDNKVGYDNMRDYDEMNIHPPIKISNINFIKNNKKDDYSRKKRRRKSDSESSSSSSDSSSEGKRKKSSYSNKDKKYEKKYEIKRKSDRKNKSPEKKEEKDLKKDKTSKFKLAPNEVKKDIKGHSKRTEFFQDEKEMFRNVNDYNNIKHSSKFQEKSDSGENTDDLMKNSPILNKFPEEKKKQQVKKERKTKFSDENPFLKKGEDVEQNLRISITNEQLNTNENVFNIENSNIMNHSIDVNHSLVKEDEGKIINYNEKKQISIVKKSGSLSIQKIGKGESNNQGKTNEEEKEEGEIEERVSKNFKIVQSSGKKKILLTNKRKVNEIKVIKKENN
jgi:hypothetical protein